jgi:hypothetical protein
MVGAAPSTNKKMLLDDFKIIGYDGVDERQFMLINRTGAGSLVSIWNSSIDSAPWTYKDINITNYISDRTCIRYVVGTAPSASKKLLLDDVKIIGNIGDVCNNNFSSTSSCWIGNISLPNGTQADCRSARFGQSNNVEELKGIYGAFGSMFAVLGYTTQIANISGDVSLANILYPDSRIYMQYLPLTEPFQYGEISLTRESPRLKELTNDTIDKPYKEGWVNISDHVKVIDAKMTSYSSDYWTDMLWVNSSATNSWRNVFNLTYYGTDYTLLGDPFIVSIPVTNMSSGNNSVRIETAIGISNKTGGSPDSRMIYSIKVKGSVGYGNVNETKQGAESDATQRLVDQVKDYVNITTDDIQTEASSIDNVPSMWGPVIVRVGMWV